MNYSSLTERVCQDVIEIEILLDEYIDYQNLTIRLFICPKRGEQVSLSRENRSNYWPGTRAKLDKISQTRTETH